MSGRRKETSTTDMKTVNQVDKKARKYMGIKVGKPTGRQINMDISKQEGKKE